MNSRSRIAATLSLTLVTAVAATALGAKGPGELDGSFDGDGRADLIPAVGQFDKFSGLAIDSRGRTVAVSGGGTPTDRDFRVTRFTRNGKPDPSFGGGDGVVETDAGGLGESDNANALAIDDSGRIIVVGSIDDGTSVTFGVVRYLRSGELDTTFSAGDGSNGVWFTDIGADNQTDRATAVALDSAGRIVVGGDQGGPGAESNFAVVRLTATGAPDTSFDGNGIQGTDFPGGVTNDQVQDLAIDGQGRIVLVGFTSGNFAADKMAVARYLPANGADDDGFNNTGALAFDFPDGTSDLAGAVAIGKGSRIILGGRTVIGGRERMAVARLDANGSLDPAFSGDGVTTIASPPGSYTTANAMIQDPDGRLILAGSADPNDDQTSPFDFAVARLKASGRRDRSFDGDGIARFGFGPGTDDTASSLARDPVTGRIVVGGGSQADTDGFLALARIEAEPRCFGKAPTIAGTWKGETLRGTNRRDVIYGGGGKDELLGRGGNDLLCGGPGKDELIGGPGRDKTDQ